MASEQGDLRVLADYVDGLLDGDEHRLERESVQQWLDADAEARANVEWLRGFVLAAREVPMCEPSPLVEQRLEQYFGRWVRAQDVLHRRAGRLQTTLIFDSRRDRPLAGVRGQAEGISLVYGCDLGELALDVYPDPSGTVHVVGQMLLDVDTTAPFFAVSAVCSGQRTVTESDELGRFRLDGLPGPSAELRLDNGEVELGASVELKPRSDHR